MNRSVFNHSLVMLVMSGNIYFFQIEFVSFDNSERVLSQAAERLLFSE